MKKILFALTALLTVASAEAGLINSVTTTLPNSGTATEVAAIKNQYFAGDNDLIFLAKFDDDSKAWEELANASLATAFTATDGGGSYTISWDLTGLGFEVWGVIVKNGGNPKNRLYEVDPSGNMRVVQGSTVVTSGASGGQNISHISFIGKAVTPGGNVPDVATGVAYAGVALVMAVASMRRRRLA